MRLERAWTLFLLVRWTPGWMLDAGCWLAGRWPLAGCRCSTGKPQFLFCGRSQPKAGQTGQAPFEIGGPVWCKLPRYRYTSSRSATGGTPQHAPPMSSGRSLVGRRYFQVTLLHAALVRSSRAVFALFSSPSCILLLFSLSGNGVRSDASSLAIIHLSGGA